MSPRSFLPKTTSNLGRLLVISAVFAALWVTFSSRAFAACSGPGAPSDTQTKCLTAVQIPGNPLRPFDISWVNPARGEYYLSDRSNAGVDVINTRTLTFKQIGRFVLCAR